MDRRLAAILFADVAGFSALMGRNEDEAVAAFKGHFAALEPIVRLHNGRLVKTMGDGFLVEFASVVDAVSCAAQMQERMAARNEAQSPDRRMDFRMGVHVGDVIVDGPDVLGDGVNLAARLQEVAEPGGLAISGRVYEEVVDRLDLAFSDMGFRSFKNIARPVRVHCLGSAKSPPSPAAPERPDKPSVAVLPFQNMSPDPEQEYFADGVAEDVITSLSYVPWLFVIARNSSFAYKGLAMDVREIGRQLGVRYVLEGSVRRAGDRLRVSGQLIDAETGVHLWAARYDGTLEDVFDLQDRISEEAVGAIAPEIRSAEIARAGRKRPENLDAYDHYLQALSAIHRTRIEEAVEHLEEAIRLAPKYAKPKAMWAWCNTLAPWMGRPVDLRKLDAAAGASEEVLDTLETDAEDEAYAGYVLAFTRRDRARGLHLVERSIARCPSFAWAWTSSALLHAYLGKCSEALDRARQALRLSPYDPMAFRTELAVCFAYLAAANYDEMLRHARRGRELNPRMPMFLRLEMVALAHLGRLDEARSICALHSGSALEFRLSHYSRHAAVALADEVRVPMLEGLRLAGVPE